MMPFQCEYCMTYHTAKDSCILGDVKDTMDSLYADREKLRDALTTIMVEMAWDRPGWDGMDLQEYMEREGLIVESDIPHDVLDEYGGSWYTMKWLAEEGKES